MSFDGLGRDFSPKMFNKLASTVLTNDSSYFVFLPLREADEDLTLRCDVDDKGRLLWATTATLSTRRREMRLQTTIMLNKTPGGEKREIKENINKCELSKESDTL